MTRKSRIPRLTRHKATGQAVVRLNGKDHYCGRWGSPGAQADYDSLIERWLAHDRQLPEDQAGGDPTVEEVLAAYLDFAERHYRRPDGSPTSELDCIKLAIRPLRRHYGESPASEFGPRALLALRDTICAEPTRFGQAPARSTVNGYIRRVKAVFMWAVTRELVPPSVYEGLRAVDGLRAGRSAARETSPVRPVTRDQVDRTLPFLRPPVAAMVELMWITGMRLGEVVLMRMGDIDRSGSIWEYKPTSHKMVHEGRDRIVPLGPQAQVVLTPYLRADPTAHLFSPRDDQERRLAERHLAATSPRPKHRRATRRPPEARAALGTRYTTDAVRRAITRAITQARATAPETPLEHWHPHQLRHAAGTRFRAEAGLEAARVLLGHSSPVVTEQHYAEVDRVKASQLMARLG